MTGCQTSKLGICLGSFISQCCQLVRQNVDGLWINYEPGTQVKTKIKVKLYLGMSWRQTCESTQVWLHSFLNSAENEGEWLPWHHSYFMPGIRWVWGWGRVVTIANWTLWRRGKSLLLGTTQFLSRSACSVVTVPGLLSWLGGRWSGWWEMCGSATFSSTIHTWAVLESQLGLCSAWPAVA